MSGIVLSPHATPEQQAATRGVARALLLDLLPSRGVPLGGESKQVANHFHGLVVVPRRRVAEAVHL